MRVWGVGTEVIEGVGKGGQLGYRVRMWVTKWVRVVGVGDEVVKDVDLDDEVGENILAILPTSAKTNMRLPWKWSFVPIDI